MKSELTENIKKLLKWRLIHKKGNTFYIVLPFSLHFMYRRLTK